VSLTSNARAVGNYIETIQRIPGDRFIRPLVTFAHAYVPTSTESLPTEIALIGSLNDDRAEPTTPTQVPLSSCSTAIRAQYKSFHNRWRSNRTSDFPHDDNISNYGISALYVVIEILRHSRILMEVIGCAIDNGY